MGRLERNTLANLTGTIWSMGLGIVCIPLVIRFLGAEAFGLVGLFLTMQSICAILDLGIGATLNREIARFSANGTDAREQRDLVFTLQALYWLAAMAIGITIAALAPLVAGYWLKPQSLSVATVTTCVRMMGAAIALQFPFVFYQAGMLGLQRHVLFNALSAVIGTLRGPGILLLLALVSATPRMYFGAQIAISAIATAAGAVLLWRLLPAAPGYFPRVRRDLLLRVWRFGAAYSANSLANLALLQGDKIILSGVLPLEMFGYYTLAQRLAAGLYAIIIAVDGAIFPRFSAAVATGDELETGRVYHRAAQLMTVLLVPPAIVAALFSREILMLWTHDPAAVRNTHVVLTLLVCGMLLHGLAQAPFYVQWAYGWWRLITTTNGVLLLTILPLYLVMAKGFGAEGAALVWVLLNIIYVATVPLMHRRFLRGEQRRWFVHDVCLPLAGSLAVAGAAYWLMPPSLGTLQIIIYLGIAGLTTTAAAVTLASEIRSLLLPRLRRAGQAEVV
jgi:O-antigen/teichoic acid export membrane protein